MPELPEVETTRNGIAPHLVGKTVTRIVVRQPSLRWPVPADLGKTLRGARLQTLERRAKYLLFGFGHGTMILHLGMSGSLRILRAAVAPAKHDHVDILFGRTMLRFHDPRRFGALLWTDKDALLHPLLKDLGPEPLADRFDGVYLHARSSTRQIPVKNLIMDGKVVVGVGNIYANEALFMAGIDPARRCSRISRQRYDRLAECIKEVLTAAIAQGGTTLQDFQQADGKPGYFAQELSVYEREHQPCVHCGHPIKKRVIGQRSSYYCPTCQR